MRRICRLKRIAFFLSILLLLSTYAASAQTSLEDMIQQAQSYLLEQPTGTYSSGADWNQFSLARSGASGVEAAAHVQAMGDYLTQTIQEKGQLTYATDYARMVLTLGALGYDARNFAGVDLMGALSTSDLVEQQGINGTIYTLLALDSKNTILPEEAVWTADRLVERLCALQKEKGYFVYVDSFGADVDLTAAAVTALAPHAAQEPAKTAVEKAINWLADTQLDTAGYAAMGVENSMSTAQVLTALCTAGIDPREDTRFIKQGTTILDSLANHLAAGGGFRYQQDDAEANEMATAQVLYALSAYERLQNGKTSVFDLRDVTEQQIFVLQQETEQQEETVRSDIPIGSVQVAVSATNVQRGAFRKPASTILYQGDSPYDLLEGVLGKENIETTGSGASVYVSGIKDEKGWLREFDYGAQSGWIYKVNGAFLSQGAGEYQVKDGDEIYWYYVTGQQSDVTDAAAFENLPAMVSDLNQYPLLLSGQTDLTDWELIYLALTDTPVSAEMLNERVREAEGAWRKVTDIERIAIAAAAIGQDPRDIEGYNLIEQIVTSDRMLSQGVNGPTYALIALDCKQFAVPEDALWTREALVEAVLSYQNEDGSFSLTQGDSGNVDITAMALQALSGYVEQDVVETAVDRALAYLSDVQEEDGSYSLYGDKNCESTAQVVLALQTLGIDLYTDARFIKNGITALEAMLAFAVTENGDIWRFRHLMDGEVDELATQQGYLAVAAVQKPQRWFDFGAAETENGYITDLDTASEWAKDSIAQAVQLGIIKGYADGSFAPRQAITRAEFVSLLVRIMNDEWTDAGAQTEPPSIYHDVEESDWFYGELAIAASHGLVVPSEQDGFRPNDPLTREEMAALLNRTGLFEQAGTADLKDDASISEWAKTSVYTIYQAGVMQGDGGYFDPQGTVTREMVAVVGMRLRQSTIEVF